MDLNFRKDRRAIALLAAPAFALALAACGGSEAPTATTTAEAPAVVEEATTATSESSETTETTVATDSTVSETTNAAAPASSGSRTPLLPADEAIANAEVNQPNLQSSQNVLDIQTLAVGDGSIATLRDVVDGDKPVLLWFFSPH